MLFHYIYTTVLLFSLISLCNFNDAAITGTHAVCVDLPQTEIMGSNYRVQYYGRLDLSTNIHYLYQN